MTEPWVVALTFNCAPDMQALDAVEDTLAEFDALVSAIPPDRFQVVVHIEADGLIDAATIVSKQVSKAVAQAPDQIGIVSEGRYDDEAITATLPEVASAPEVAEMLGVSRQRVHQLRANPDFPAPLYELRMGAVWDARAIRHFAHGWDRTPGRRKSAPACF